MSSSMPVEKLERPLMVQSASHNDWKARMPSRRRCLTIRSSYEISPEERMVKQRLREGILAFQSLWLALCTIKGRSNFSTGMLDDMDRNAASVLYRLMDYPTKPEADR